MRKINILDTTFLMDFCFCCYCYCFEQKEKTIFWVLIYFSWVFFLGKFQDLYEDMNMIDEDEEEEDEEKGKKLGVGGTCKIKQTCESNGPLLKKKIKQFNLTEVDLFDQRR